MVCGGRICFVEKLFLVVGGRGRKQKRGRERANDTEWRENQGGAKRVSVRHLCNERAAATEEGRESFVARDGASNSECRVLCA